MAEPRTERQSKLRIEQVVPVKKEPGNSVSLKQGIFQVIQDSNPIFKSLS